MNKSSIDDQVITQEKTVRCAGNGGPLGHPAVFLAFNATDLSATCPYCSRQFIRENESTTS